MSDVVLEQVKTLTATLSPEEKAELREWLAAEEKIAEKPQIKPRRELLGLWKDVHIADEDIDQARREMWINSLN